MQPELFASAEACDWSMRFVLGREAGAVIEKFGGNEVGGPYPDSGRPSEAPSTKLQAPKKHQAPSTKQQIEIAIRTFEVWNLELLWSLELGAWSFISTSASASKSRCRENHRPCRVSARDNQKPDSFSRDKCPCSLVQEPKTPRRP